ncbi:peamaclein-like [Gossypium australe]|uniref:Peamaclein-like n=1 Tax=Gossypium australe TaxID=47621 RepID=A0A5B6UI24_9ROSI|nr:peamaclein-like [Gossypium australe]
MKLLFATLLFMFLVLGSSFVRLSFAKPVAPHPRPAAPATIPPPSPAAHPPPSFCDKKCGERCKKAGVKDRCLKYCGICCRDCKCVPSGTYGNKSECRCYRDKLNSKGNPKCP